MAFSMSRVGHGALAIVVGVSVALAGAPAYAGSKDRVSKIRGSEYLFLGVPKTLDAGKHTLRFRDVGGESHEMMVVKLGEGMTVDDVMPAEDHGGAAEGAMGEHDVMEGQELIGVVHLERQHDGKVPSGSLTYRFTPGTYALVCFITAPDGMSHFAHGMKAEFTVKN